MTAVASKAEYSSLHRGLEILALLQQEGRLRTSAISERLGIPLSTAYRYAGALRESGFAVESDGYLIPSSRLTEPGRESEHLVQYSAPVLHRMRERTGCTAVLAVRIHTAALCLEAAVAHPKDQISFQRGRVRGLHAGATALPLLAYAPPGVLREVLETDLRRYTSATPDPQTLEREVRQIRSRGYTVSYGQLTPGMVGVGVPVLVDGRCLCSLSLVGDAQSPFAVDQLVEVLNGGANELLARMTERAVREAWVNQDDE